MSDKIEREIEEILNRLDESVPGEGMPDRVRGLFRDWTANLRRAIGSRLARVSLRRFMLGSLVLVVLVAAGLFFGLAYPSLGRSPTSAGSGGGEIMHEGVGDQIGEGVDVDDARPEGSVDEGPGMDRRESQQGVDRPPEVHGERHSGDSEHR